MGRWINVKDRLPELEEAEYFGIKWGMSKQVLVTCGEKYAIAKLVRRFMESGEYTERWETEHCVSVNVTHWIPLPEMPIEG